MSESVPALVEKELLQWARRSSGLSLEDAARKIGISSEALGAWESGDKAPTVAQLRHAARVYKRPLAVFYLSAPPTDFEALRDFRQMPGTVGPLGPQLRFAIRRAHELRHIAVDLAESLEQPIPPFSVRADLATPPQTVAASLRKRLEVPLAEQVKARNPRTAFNLWRTALERRGVFVFQFPEPPLGHNAVEITEARGFSIPEATLPVVGINARDAFAGRVFTLFHELTHVALRAAGLCDLVSAQTLPPEKRKIEVFCNSVAAEFLVPEADFRSVISSASLKESWTDREIEEAVQRYSVSREVIVRRLLELRLTTRAFYQRKRREYAEEAARNAKAQAESSNAEFKMNMPMLVLRSVGRTFAATAFRALREGKVTASDVAGFLGVKTKHFSKIEKSLTGAMD